MKRINYNAYFLSAFHKLLSDASIT